MNCRILQIEPTTTEETVKKKKKKKKQTNKLWTNVNIRSLEQTAFRSDDALIYVAGLTIKQYSARLEVAVAEEARSKD